MALIRSATEDDSHAIAGIYNHYILNTIVTFEEQPVSPRKMSGRIDKVLGDSLPDLVGFKFDRWIDVGYWQRVLG